MMRDVDHPVSLILEVGVPGIFVQPIGSSPFPRDALMQGPERFNTRPLVFVFQLFHRLHFTTASFICSTYVIE